MKFPKKITLWRMGSHDFNRALRIWRKHQPEKEIFVDLLSERAKALKLMTQSLLLSVVITIWLSANKANLALKISLIEIEIPKAYVNFSLSMLLLGTTMNLFNYFVLNEFLRVSSSRLFKFDTPWALSVFQDGGNAWSIGMIRQYRFFQSTQSHAKFSAGAILLLCLPILMYLLVAYWTIYSVGFDVIIHEPFISSRALITLFGWMMAAYPIVHIIATFVPFSFDANRRFVRWNFLTPMHRRIGRLPPNLTAWLSADMPPSSEKTIEVSKSGRTRSQIERENESRTAYLRKKYMR